MNKAIPKINTQLRSHTILVPEVYREATGVLINGKRIKSLVFSTDVAVIANCNADAVIAVYPFTPTIQITEAIISVAQRPVFVGVGGGTTAGKRVESIALDAELHGATAVVLNAPTATEFVQNLADDIDIPVVLTIVSLNDICWNCSTTGAAWRCRLTPRSVRLSLWWALRKSGPPSSASRAEML